MNSLQRKSQLLVKKLLSEASLSSSLTSEERRLLARYDKKLDDAITDYVDLLQEVQDTTWEHDAKVTRLSENLINAFNALRKAIK